MFKKIDVWDPTIMTKGTVVKITGYSHMNDFRFKGLEYKVINTQYESLFVQAKNGKKYEIEMWELGDSLDYGLTVEIISQVPYEIPF